MLLAITMLATLPEVSKAQTCPPDGWERYNWTGPYTVIESVPDPNGGYCPVLVYYCLPVDPTEPIIYIDGVEAQSGCDDMSGDQIIKGAEEQVYLDPTLMAKLGVPNCQELPAISVELALASCWAFYPVGSPTIPFYYPCSLDAFCLLRVIECIDNSGSVQVHQTDAEVLGVSECDPPLPTWVPLHCYDILPCATN